MLFCLLATRGAVFSVHFQYSAIILPVAFALIPGGARGSSRRAPSCGALGLDGARLCRALLVAAFAASLLVSWKFGGIVENPTFRGGFVHVARGTHRQGAETYAWVREQIDKIPPRASVGVTNRVGAHASNRMAAVFYPEQSNVDWLFIDEAELQGADLDKHNKNLQNGPLRARRAQGQARGLQADVEDAGPDLRLGGALGLGRPGPGAPLPRGRSGRAARRGAPPLTRAFVLYTPRPAW